MKSMTCGLVEEAKQAIWKRKRKRKRNKNKKRERRIFKTNFVIIIGTK